MDHETSGAQEWQLPGYGRAPVNPRGLSHQSNPQPAGSSTAPTVRNEPPRPSYSTVAATGGQQYNASSARGTQRASRARANSRSRRPYTARGASHRSTPLFPNSPSKAALITGDKKPTDIVKLPATFGSFKNQFFGVARSTLHGRKLQATQGRLEVFQGISRKTGAFVQAPRHTDTVISLWGGAAQVASAKELLLGLLDKCTLDAPQQKGAWVKIHAKNAGKEANAEMKERPFPEKLLFLWPKEGPSLYEALGQQLEALDVLRAKYNCHLFVPKGLPDFICALGQDHDTIKNIAHRLRTKWVETVASSNIKSKVYVIEPPSPTAMKKKIMVKHENHLARPLLRGNKLKGLDLESWQDISGLIQSKNNARVLKAVETSLKGLIFVRGHLRMRVNIGLFVLDEYRAPKEGSDSYSFEEFREMLLHEQTKGRLIPGLKVSQEEFLARFYNATDLLETYGSATSLLDKVEPAYSVNFEFLGSNNSMLRLEVEFAKSPLAEEYEVTQRRWLRPRKSGQSNDRRPPLQIGVIDFERSDWQLEIKSLEFHEASSIDASLKEFGHSVKIPHNTKITDISAPPRRKVIFKDSPPVSRLVEKTAFRYRLKGTDYTLEVARYDEYVRKNLFNMQDQSVTAAAGQFSEVPFTSWGASIFDSKWDNLLGEHANLPVGQSAKYNPNLDTFFLPRQSAVPNEKGAGFWELVDLVKRVAEVLGPTRISPEGTQELSGPESEARSTVVNRMQGAIPGSSPATSAKNPRGMMDADLGTLF
ncbi:hypothetical protein HFD88_006675 [Aspergillus terreus]|nr:hypothetical protein HFD88_006675 [Aspergillus terreus]